MKKLKRNAPMIAVIGTVIVTSAGCTLDDVLTIAKIVGRPVRQLPLTAERVWETLNEEVGQ